MSAEGQRALKLLDEGSDLVDRLGLANARAIDTAPEQARVEQSIAALSRAIDWTGSLACATPSGEFRVRPHPRSVQVFLGQKLLDSRGVFALFNDPPRAEAVARGVRSAIQQVVADDVTRIGLCRRALHTDLSSEREVALDLAIELLERPLPDILRDGWAGELEARRTAVELVRREASVKAAEVRAATSAIVEEKVGRLPSVEGDRDVVFEVGRGSSGRAYRAQVVADNYGYVRGQAKDRTAPIFRPTLTVNGLALTEAPPERGIRGRRNLSATLSEPAPVAGVEECARFLLDVHDEAGEGPLAELWNAWFADRIVDAGKVVVHATAPPLRDQLAAGAKAARPQLPQRPRSVRLLKIASCSLTMATTAATMANCAAPPPTTHHTPASADRGFEITQWHIGEHGRLQAKFCGPDGNVINAQMRGGTVVTDRVPGRHCYVPSAARDSHQIGG